MRQATLTLVERHTPATVTFPSTLTPPTTTPPPASQAQTTSQPPVPSPSATALPSPTLTHVVESSNTPVQFLGRSTEIISATLPYRGRASTSLPGIQWDQASEFLGQIIQVCGPVVGAHYAASSKGQPTFLNLGEDYPSSKRFQVVIWGDERNNFPGKPEEIYLNKTICVLGKVEEYQGMFEMEADHASDITILPGTP